MLYKQTVYILTFFCAAVVVDEDKMPRRVVQKVTRQLSFAGNIGLYKYRKRTI